MGPRIGIVLSGGGSRGLAHAGVLEVLVDEGLAPEVVSGTSAGALVGALYAAGYDTDAILGFFEKTSPFRVSHLAPFGKPGWVDTDKIRKDFLEFFPDDSFEALDRRLFVSATDLVRARLEVFSEGELIRPLLASASVPLVFTPTRVGDTLYADGGILDNFPTKPLEGTCDVVVGVYVSPLQELAPKSLDNSIAVTQRALEIGMHLASQRKFRHTDVMLTPEGLSEFGMFDLKRHKKIVDLGRRAARERIDEIRELAKKAG